MTYRHTLLALTSLLITTATAFADDMVFAVTTSSKLIRFAASTPGVIEDSAQITGLLDSNENILGIDFRPTTNQLYGLTSARRIITINLDTAVATTVGAGGLIFPGSSFGMDFNPAVDRIRFV